MFTKKDRGTFKYTIAHVLAYNSTAIVLGQWRPRHLFHDWEKPWMLLIAKLAYKIHILNEDPYQWVRSWHKTHRKHHCDYYRDATLTKPRKDVCPVDIIIDWECSRYTKGYMKGASAYEYYMSKRDSLPEILKIDLDRAMKELHLWPED